MKREYNNNNGPGRGKQQQHPPLHNIPSPGVLMKSIGEEFYDWLTFLESITCVGCSIK